MLAAPPSSRTSLGRSMIMLGVAVIAACGETARVTPAPGTPMTSLTSPASPDSGAAGPPAAAATGLVSCPLAAGGTVDVQYDRSCKVDADCTFADTPVSCCGTRRVLGINVGERARIVAGLCPPQIWHACACTPEPTTSDDHDILFGGDSPASTCAAGVCTTHVARVHLLGH